MEFCGYLCCYKSQYVLFAFPIYFSVQTLGKYFPAFEKHVMKNGVRVFLNFL